MGCNNEIVGDFMQCELKDTAKFTKDKEFVYRDGTKYARITEIIEPIAGNHEIIIASRISKNNFIDGQLIAIMIKEK